MVWSQKGRPERDWRFGCLTLEMIVSPRGDKMKTWANAIGFVLINRTPIVPCPNVMSPCAWLMMMIEISCECAPEWAQASTKDERNSPPPYAEKNILPVHTLSTLLHAHVSCDDGMMMMMMRYEMITVVPKSQPPLFCFLHAQDRCVRIIWLQWRSWTCH